MATGFDALIDFLLSEIALCGTQGMWVRSSNLSLAAYLHSTFGGHTSHCHCSCIVARDEFSAVAVSDSYSAPNSPSLKCSLSQPPR
jgi:hypothetical protein